MTVRLEPGRRASGPETGASVGETSETLLAAESALELAPARGTTRQASASVSPSREARIAEDAHVARTTARALAIFGDANAVMHLLQLASRDMQSAVRHEGIEARHQIADVASELREAMIAQSREDAHQADFWSDIANVLGKVAAVVGAVASLAVSWCTGGASALLAVGLIIAVFGPMISEALGDAGVIPRDVAMGVGIGCAVVGSILSFGAGSAGAAGSVASQAVQITADACRYTVAALQTAQGTMQISAAVEGADAQHRMADSQAAGHEAEAAMNAAEDETQELASVFRLFARMAQRMREIEESRGEQLRIAAGARA